MVYMCKLSNVYIWQLCVYINANITFLKLLSFMEMFLDLIVLIVIILIVLAAVIILINPQILEALHLGQTSQNAGAALNLPSGDAAEYLALKNLSCQTLSKDFEIVVHTEATPAISGFIPSNGQESIVMDGILRSLSFNSTNFTYSKGDEMKQVEIGETANTTTVWKNGRVYNCRDGCTSHLISAKESSDYYDMLYRMRSECAYLGKTPLPNSINVSRLLSIKDAGPKTFGYFICRDFIITGDQAYAQALLRNSTNLDDKQKDLLWNIAHLSAPMEECLDQASGLVILRDMSLDLTRVYDMRFADNGFLTLHQKTELLGFNNNVPESFLDLPT